MSTSLVIIESPSNLGLKPPYAGHEPGVKKLPDWLRRFGLHAALKPETVYRLEPPPWRDAIDEASGVRNADAIREYAGAQAALLEKLLASGRFLLALGGDCSILIGHALGLKRLGRYGLFFLDGHTDYSWPGMSETGGAAGMDFAIVVGRGPEKLTDIDNRKPYFLPQHCVNAGNRDEDPEYVRQIVDSGIPYYPLHRMRSEGIAKAANDFLQMAEREKLDGFWIHVDADVLDNDIMPAVDSPAPGGLSYEEWMTALAPLVAHPKVVGMEITIIDPERDPDGRYSGPFVQKLVELLRPVT